MKYAFNHDEKRIDEAMGIDEQRGDALNSAATKAAFSAHFADETINSKTKMIEMCINEAQPESVIEALFLGFCLGRSDVHIAATAKKMADF